FGERKAAGEVHASFVKGAGTQRYRILGTLGEGGMGVVYRAEDTRLGRNVAVKTVPAALTANLQAKKRFLNEARAASSLDHPNICTIYEIDETDTGQVFLTMPCYDGETLRDRLRRSPLSLPEAVDTAQQVAHGLAKVHGLGLVHCDVKPENLFLTGEGTVKILDFGIARLSELPVHSRSGPYGTRGYRSPEQARGDEADASSDVWSLGAVLYEMVTGRSSCRDKHGEVVPWEEWDPVARKLPKALPELDHLLSRMLAGRPTDRYRNGDAAFVHLDRLAGRVKRDQENPRGYYPRRRVGTAAVGIAVLCLAVLGGYLRYRVSGNRWAQSPVGSEPHTTEPTLV